MSAIYPNPRLPNSLNDCLSLGHEQSSSLNLGLGIFNNDNTALPTPFIPQTTTIRTPRPAAAHHVAALLNDTATTTTTYRGRQIPLLPSNISSISATCPVPSLTVNTVNHTRRHSLSSVSPANADVTLASMVPLPPYTSQQVSSIDSSSKPMQLHLSTNEVPLTPMEEQEGEEGIFGSAPLEVVDGVAVTEESVGLHVPDVITQF